MKKRVSILVLVLMLWALPVIAAQNVTIYGDDNYTPYSYLEGNSAKGIYVDILQKAFSMMPDYSVTLEMVPWKRALKLTEKGKAFALFPPYHQPAKRPWIEPYSEPILEEAVVVMCRDDNMASPRPNWPQDYKGLTIGVNEGFAAGREAGEQGIVTLEEAASNEKNIIKLINRRIDCYVNDRFAMLHTFNSVKAAGKYKEGRHAKLIEGTVLSKEFGYLGYSKNGNFPFKADFVAKFDAVIKKMKADGTIDKIVAKYK